MITDKHPLQNVYGAIETWMSGGQNSLKFKGIIREANYKE